MNTDKIYPQVDDVPEDVYREWLSPKPVTITYDSYTGEEIVLTNEEQKEYEKLLVDEDYYAYSREKLIEIAKRNVSKNSTNQRG